ncbi:MULTISPECIES: hypothetical protein [unclassified Micromonospora]
MMIILSLPDVTDALASTAAQDRVIAYRIASEATASIMPRCGQAPL